MYKGRKISDARLQLPGFAAPVSPPPDRLAENRPDIDQDTEINTRPAGLSALKRPPAT
jgi:hypothetical protein